MRFNVALTIRTPQGESKFDVIENIVKVINDYCEMEVIFSKIDDGVYEA